jgi:acetyl-CoA acetyltransferase
MSRDLRRLRGRVAIVGAAEADEHGKLPHKSAFMLHAEAARNALADAGLSLGDVDAVFSAGLWMGSETAEYLGIRPRYIDGTQIGGCSFIAHVQHAMAAIDAGIVEVALITHGESGASRIGMPGTRFGVDAFRLQFEQPFGLAGPPTGYALAAARHMHEYGTTSEQLAELAVSTRKWAQLNPRAIIRDPLAVDDVLSSRMISWPLHLLDCCLVTDAGGAVVVTSAERARDCAKRPVWVLGTGEASTHVIVSQMPDFGFWDAARMSSERAFAMAGVRHADIDVAMFYDAFTIVPVMGLEATGFCGRGEGGPFVSGGRTAPGGPFPMNTNGGGLSYTHPGMYGMFLIVEAVRQLRGECGRRQVAGAEVAVAHGSGMVLSCMSTLVLGTEATR